MTRRTLGIALVTLLSLASPALANTITITSSALPAMTLNPSSDVLSLNAGSATLSAPGNVLFQSGAIAVGDSEIPDQVIPFFFHDTITINGVTKILTFSGQNNVTNTADIISIFSSTPVSFGSYVFTLSNATYTANTIGQTIPVTLSANITAVPEPATLPLLATGIMGGALLTRRLRRTAVNL